MKANELMTRDVRLANPDETIQQAAKMMAEIDAGFLPVGDDDRLVGMVTDRDIAVRAVAKGLGPDARIGEVMTPDVKYCFEDEDTDYIAHNMANQQIRRICVLDRNKQLVGVLSLGDLAFTEGREPAGDALTGISQPGGLHTQTGESHARA
ncbi:CBS domain-containing protein [Chelativorans sp. YIM 93263]|uniref:CBS domain-containing protein n=1 Tax=Chelativorans sp. YIM 93263 TaxID=2906648 RepID=UPI002379057F|nr:CBS domain-containing protein [Chelativorans sp. YIM 93263]